MCSQSARRASRSGPPGWFTAWLFGPTDHKTEFHVRLRYPRDPFESKITVSRPTSTSPYRRLPARS